MWPFSKYQESVHTILQFVEIVADSNNQPQILVQAEIFFLYYMPTLKQSTFSCQGETNLENFVVKLKELKLGQVECNHSLFKLIVYWSF